MSGQQDKEKIKLFSLDEKLRAEADQLLEQSGIGTIIRQEGFKPVGSYVMRTMTWRDLDFERTNENPSWEQHWKLGLKLARIDMIWGFRCIDGYHDPRNPGDKGFYWGLHITSLLNGETWKIDLWTARATEFELASPKRSLWENRLTEDRRYSILAIKEAVWNLPEYRQDLLSVHIYEAVLEYDIENLQEFWVWWKKQYGK
jgi:hypothetical protein